MRICPSCNVEVAESGRYCSACGTRLQVSASAQRQELQAITVVFCDLVDSTGLTTGLELLPLQRTLDRFYEMAQRIFIGHGGQVGTRGGDGFMGVFGIPTAHDDDALRAVRAAAELQDGMSVLSAEVRERHNLPLAARIGINTGRVLIRSEGSSVEELVTGPPVILARRLEDNADPGGILIGEETYALVRDAVRADRSEPLQLKGFQEPVVAWRVNEVVPDVPGRIRRLDRPIIGRWLEQRLLWDLFERTIADRCCHLVAVLGPAGIGKSKLVEEFVQALGSQAMVLRGHCLPYGDSVTFWPIMEVVTQAAGIAPTDPEEVAYERLAAPLRDSDRAREITLRVAHLIGLEARAGLPGDSFSALQAYLEALARRHPVVVFIDDMHWAEPSLLDAIEHIAEHAKGPIMLLCLARPDELLRRRDRWPGWKPNTFSISLAPLGDEESEKLVEGLLEGQRLDLEVLTYITYLAQGNPLIVEELVDRLIQLGVLIRSGGRWVATTIELDQVVAPPSIEALLVARLARLDDEAQAIIARAAVVGKQFHAADIVALSPEMRPSEVTRSLDELCRRELIERDHTAVFPLPAVEGGEGYSFRHILIRNVAYDRMTEEVRANRHEQYASWVEQTAGDRLSQFDELIAYHLNEAYDYLRRLGPLDAAGQKLARRAGERYAAAGHRAALRGDTQLALALLRRAAQLLPADSPSRIAVLPDFAHALRSTGELQQALRAYDELIVSAKAAEQEAEAMHATLERLYVLAFTDADHFLRDARREAERAIELFTRQHDGLGLARAWCVVACADLLVGRSGEACAAAVQARGHAQEAGSRTLETRMIRLYCRAMLSGTTPEAEVRERAREGLALARSTGMRALEAATLTVLADTAVLRSDFEEAREHNEAASAITLELGELLQHASDAASRALVPFFQQDLTAAAETLREGYETLERMAATTQQVGVAVLLARVFAAQGRYGEAEELIGACEQLAAKNHADPQIKCRSVKALLIMHRGRLEEAELGAREAVELAETTDLLGAQAQAHADLATVLRIATRREEAVQELERALRAYRRKGDHTGVRMVRRELLKLRP
jgi:class 3 adenylate cyclase/tetratricopeptide (TPR) repeat protein